MTRYARRRRTDSALDTGEVELLKQYLREAAQLAPGLPPDGHPPPAVLRAHARGQLDGAAARSVRIHALYCRECFSRLTALAASPKPETGRRTVPALGHGVQRERRLRRRISARTNKR